MALVILTQLSILCNSKYSLLYTADRIVLRADILPGVNIAVCKHIITYLNVLKNLPKQSSHFWNSLNTGAYIIKNTMLVIFDVTLFASPSQISNKSKKKNTIIYQNNWTCEQGSAITQ